MESIMVKGINWVKGFALFGMMVALVGMLAVAPGASAASARLAPTAVPVPITSPGKISVLVVDGSSTAVGSAGIANANVVVSQYSSEGTFVVLKGETDANGRFESYIAEGTYRVSITANGYKEFSQIVKVSRGQGTQVTAKLEADATTPISY